MLELVLMLAATLLLLLAAFAVDVRRVVLGWLGLAVFVFTLGVLPHLQ